MHVAHQVQQPNQVVGLEQIGFAGSKSGAEYGDLLHNRRNGNRGQLGAVHAERGVDEMPVFMPQLGPIPVIQRREFSLGDVVVSRKGVVGPDLVGPCGCHHEHIHILVGSRCSGRNKGQPFRIIRVEFQQDRYSGPFRWSQLLVGSVGHRHVPHAVPCKSLCTDQQEENRHGKKTRSALHSNLAFGGYAPGARSGTAVLGTR